MKFLILGDVHANWPSMSQHVFNNVLAKGYTFDAIIQVGDLGYYEVSMGYFMHYARKFKCPFHFIDGNHEQHDFLNATYKNINKFDIWYHPRGDVTVLPDGTKIGWMGGAFNVDHPQDFNKDGSQNFPSKEDVARAITNINNVGGVDLMVTHSCPHSIRVGMQGNPGFLPSIGAFIHNLGYTTGELWDCGDQPLLDLWNGLVIKPSINIFGHFHDNHKKYVGNTKFYCVGVADTHYGIPQVYIYDTISKEISINGQV